MPLGGNHRPVNDGAPLIVPVPPQSLPPAAPDLLERQAGSEVWFHRTLVPADFVSGLARVDFPGQVTALSVYAPAGVPLYLGLDRPGTSSAANAYDVFHPGSGYLSDRVRPIGSLYVATSTGAAPGAAVEVYGYAGSYAIGIG